MMKKVKTLSQFPNVNVTSAQLQVLHDEVPPLSSNENYGIDTFLQVLQFIETIN